MSKTEIPEIQIVGPFATEYSLAKVNRELATNLAEITKDYKISLWGDESTVDRLPKASDFKKYPQLRDLYQEKKTKPKIAIVNTFPKSFPHSFGLEGIDADIKIAYLAWEESGFPQKIVEEFNKHLHGLMVTSDHVMNIFRKAGVKIPIVNVSEGINQNLLTSEKYSLKTKKSFKFLHVSSGIPRKGVDVLIKAYFEEFGKNDDVVLVIKTYHNDENVIPDLLKTLQKPDSPEIEVVYDLELTEGQIAYLYKQADCVVIPSRAEGFGLPIAEAMLKKVPVITTGYSGQMDFADEDNSWLIDYEIVRAQSQLGLVNSYWAEPDPKQLQKEMRYLFEKSGKEEVDRRVESAYEVAKGLTWEKTAKSVLEFVGFCEKIAPLKKQKLAVVTTYNSVCGIAEYSKDLYPLIESSFGETRYFANADAEVVFKDSVSVTRTWEYSERDFGSTIKALEDYDPDVVHVQYNAPFYSVQSLAGLVEELKTRGKKVLVTLHSIPDIDMSDFADNLEKADRILIHSQSNFDELKREGYENVEKFTHGIKHFQDENKLKLRQKLDITKWPIIASHGLIHERKGLLEIIEALNLLKNDYPEILFLSVNAVNTDNSTSSSVFRQMKEQVAKHGLEDNVLFVSEFLAKEEIIKLLHLADLMLLPYGDLQEGASGAVRYSLASNRPVITTNSAIFSDLGEAVYRIEDNSPVNIMKAVRTLMEDEKQYMEQLLFAREFVGMNSWEKLSHEILEIMI